MLVVLGLTISACSAAALGGLKAFGGMPLLVATDSVESPQFDDPILLRPSDAEHFRQALAVELAGTHSEEARVLKILAWTMNQVPKIDAWEADSAWQMVEQARAGRGLVCGGMARIFHDALVSHGIRARIVLLQRNLFDPRDTHATVEAYVDGAWRLYDPTFHLTLNMSQRRVGALEARRAIFAGKNNLALNHLGSTNYPARTDNYYISYTSLMNNIYVQRPIMIFGMRVPVAYFQREGGVSELGPLAYSRLLIGLVCSMLIGGLIASVAAVGYLAREIAALRR